MKIVVGATKIINFGIQKGVFVYEVSLYASIFITRYSNREK